MTEEEIQRAIAELERMEKEANVAPTGATETRDFSLPRAALANFANAWSGGKLPEYLAQASTVGKGLLSDLDTAASAIGFPDLMGDQQAPIPQEELARYNQGLEALNTEHPNAALGGEIAGMLTNPGAVAVGAKIAQLPGAATRIPATAGAVAAEDVNYNYNRGMRGEDLMDNALTAGLFGAGGQVVAEGLGRVIRRFGQGAPAGEARAMDQIRSTNIASGAETPADLARMANEAGPHAIAADISPDIMETAGNAQLPLYALKRFNTFMRSRVGSSRDNLRNRIEGEFPPRTVLTPGDIDNGIEAYRKSLQPRYTAALDAMDRSGALVNGTTLRETLENTITRLPDGSRDLGAPMDAYRDVVKTIDRFAVDKLGAPEVKRLKREVRNAAREAAEAAGLEGADLRDAMAEATDNFTALDYVEFTPREIHRMKQSIDKKISGVPFGIADKDIHRRALIQTRQELANSLGSLSPQYRALNAEFAGTATAKEAYQFGSDLLKSKDTIRDLPTKMQEFEPGDIPFLVEGLQSKMIEQLLEADTAKAASKMLRDPTLGAKLSEVIGEEAATSLLRDVGNFVTQAQTADRAMKIWDTSRKREFKEAVSGAWKNIVDLGLMGGVLANTLGSGAIKGPGLYSGAFMGSARRAASNLMGADVAKGQALTDIAMMPAAKYADLIRDMPTKAPPMAVPGWVPGMTAAATATDPVVTGQGLMDTGQAAQQSILDLIEQLSR